MPSRYERRIIRLGDSDAITLPKEWRDYQDFKKDIEENDDKTVEMLANRVIVVWMKGDKKAEARAHKMMEEHG